MGGVSVSLVVEARLLDGRLARVAVGEDGLVAGLHGPGWPVPAGARLYRAPGGTVAGPAFVDIHVHLRGLGLSYKEDESSGTMAALAGGVAVVADMPNTRPELRSPEALRAKLDALARLSHADYAVWAGVPRGPREASVMLSLPGVAGFKVYPVDLESQGLTGVLAAAARAGAPVVVHPELPGDVSEECPLGRRGVECRPPWAEVGAVHRVSSLAPPGLRVHVTHATTPATVAAARARGYTVDVTMHHVLMDSRREAGGCEFKVNPPLRPPATARALRRLLSLGAVDAVASDHAPHAPWEKGLGDPECPPGIPGVEYTARLLLTLAARGELSLHAVWRLYSAAPAGVAGLEGYGCLAPGCRAAVVVVDPRREGVIGETTRDYSRAGPQAWRGTRYVGEPVALVLGDAVVMEEGEVYSREARRRARPAVEPGLRGGARA